MRNRLVYYVSGHGWGHARRAAVIARGLVETYPGLELVIRTSAPPYAFAGRLPEGVPVLDADFDAGAAEEDAFTIDPHGTAERARRLLGRREEIVAREGAYLRSSGVELILADVPFLAGDIARAAGVPCVAISNFTWDWIYEPLFAEVPDGEALLREIGEAYSRVDVLLRLALGSGGGATIPRVVDVPVAGYRSPRPVEELLRELGLPADGRPRVLVAQRGFIPGELLERVARDLPELLFLAPHDAGPATPENLRSLPARESLAFDDVLKISDLVVSKPGWGILTDCLAGGVGLLWVPREGFREDALSLAEASQWMRMQRLSREEYEAGEWGAGLRALAAMPVPAVQPRLDGARVCAEWLAGV